VLPAKACLQRHQSKALPPNEQATVIAAPRQRGSRSVPQLGLAIFFGAMIAAVEDAVFLQAMSENPTTAFFTCWRERLDGAFETIEGVRFTSNKNLEGLVVIIAACLTLSHSRLR